LFWIWTILIIMYLLLLSYILNLILSVKWHARVGHVRQGRMSRLAKQGL